MKKESDLCRMWVAEDGKLTGYSIVGEILEMKRGDAGERRAKVVLWSGGNPDWKLKETVQRGTKMFGVINSIRIVQTEKLEASEELGWKL